MNGRHRVRRYKFALIVLLDVAAFYSAFAQQAPSPTLDEILLRLNANLQHYDSQVPSFFCSEHVVSSVVYNRKREGTVTDSVFRLKRSAKPGQTGTLDESREIKAVNGSPVQGEHIGGPSILSGAFSGGLDLVSLDQKACMSYTLRPGKPGQTREPYVVQFATLPSIHHLSGCLLNEDGTGSISIDPATMQATRMEFTIPRHTILPGTVGVWKVSIKYSPVLLGGQTFWMPARIVSTAISGFDDNLTVWSFSAHYTDYHKLEVTSRILLPGESPAP